MANKYIFNPNGVTLKSQGGDIILNAGPGIIIQPQGNMVTFSSQLPQNAVINGITPYQPAQITDNSAGDNTLYYSTTSGDLSYKDLSGTVHHLYSNAPYTYNFYDYYPNLIGSSADITAPLQDFLLYCQLQALALKPATLDNLGQRATVNAYLPRAYFRISCPIIVPEYVNLICDGQIIRTGSSGTATNFYTGDTATKALANKVLPTVIFVPRSLCDKLCVIATSNGADNGSGVAVGKTWFASSFGIVTAGAAYQVGDLLTASQPSVAYYAAFVAEVTSVNGSGAITGVSVSNAGAYGLPPVLQSQQWTSANGFAVFDVNGNFLWTGGHGTGAVLSVSWAADFAGGQYVNGGSDLVIEDLVFRNITIEQVGQTIDATYGSPFALCGNHLFNATIDQVETEGGVNGFIFQFGSDTRLLSINPVNTINPIVIEGEASFECSNCVFDTMTGSIFIDNSNVIKLGGVAFFRNRVNVGNAPAILQLGQNSSGSQINSSLALDFVLEAAGSGGDSLHISAIGCPALALAYTTSFDINLVIANKIEGYSGTFPVVNKFAIFGSNIGSGRLRGYIEVTFGSIFSGAIPAGVDMDIWDADVSITNGSVTATIGGSATIGDVVNIIFTNANLAYSYQYPRTASYTVMAGDTTTTIAAALVAAINAEAVLSITGVVAANAANVITIIQMGADANITTLSSHVTGSGTETVTLSNGGAVSGSVAGGRVRSGGLYDLFGNGPPQNGPTGTGWAKAPAGSSYKDISTGYVYTNTGSISSPSWVRNITITSGLFANKPSGPLASQTYFATDLGSAGMLIFYNGSKWMPVGGIAILANAAPNASHTGDQNETNLAITALPAGLVSATGSIRITSQWSTNNNANNKLVIIRHNTTSGAVAGGTQYLDSDAVSVVSEKYITQFYNQGSQSSQVGFQNSGGYGLTTGSAVTGSINMANASYINFNMLNFSASTDTVTLVQYTVEWLEP